jgi:hypothetical protein
MLLNYPPAPQSETGAPLTGRKGELWRKGYQAGYDEGFKAGHAKERWLKEQVEKDAVEEERKRMEEAVLDALDAWDVIDEAWDEENAVCFVVNEIIAGLYPGKPSINEKEMKRKR